MKERFNYGSLRFECSSEVQNIALDDGYFKHHFLLLFIENVFLDRIKISCDVIESRETRIEKHLEYVIEKMRRRFTHVKSAFPLAFFKGVKKLNNLINIVFVSGYEVIFGENDIHFPRVGGAIFCVKKRNMNGKEETIVKVNSFWLVGRC